MNKIEYWLTTIALILSIQHAYSQTSFIATDSSVYTGEKIILGTEYENALYIKVKDKKGEITTYTANDLLEYGLKNGQIYRSFNVGSDGKNERYFFLRLFKGKYNIYYLPGSIKTNNFYITTNDSLSLVAIPNNREAYLDFLKAYIDDCPQATENIEHVELTKNSLTRFFMDYQTCSNSYLPRLRFGYKMGISYNKLNPTGTAEILTKPDYQFNSDFFLGAFVDIPIGTSNYSLITSPSFNNYASSIAFESLDRTYDLIINEWRLNVPVLARLSFFNHRTVPFIETGPLYSVKLKGENTLFNYSTTGDNIYIELDEAPFIPTHQLGFSLGAGIILKYNSDYSFMFRAGFNKCYGIVKQKESLIVNDVSFTTGLMF